MIKIENIEVFGWEAAIRGMRNPMNSWDKSDSIFNAGFGSDSTILGENDLKLMQSLIKAGTDDSKFMRMINVTMDITAPMYFNKELDTYKVSTVRNSCSTMHKIHSKEFTLDDFSHEHLIQEHNFELSYTIKETEEVRSSGICIGVDNVFNLIINVLNYYRNKYLETKNKEYWWQMIQLLPSSYNQKFTWQANYQVLRNIYFARRNHKLDEWRDFCKIIEELPYSKELICLEDR